MSLREGLYNTTMRECGFTKGFMIPAMWVSCKSRTLAESEQSTKEMTLFALLLQRRVAYRWHLDLGLVSGVECVLCCSVSGSCI